LDRLSLGFSLSLSEGDWKECGEPGANSKFEVLGGSNTVPEKPHVAHFPPPVFIAGGD